jgi:hypothetical protein
MCLDTPGRTRKSTAVQPYVLISIFALRQDQNGAGHGDMFALSASFTNRLYTVACRTSDLAHSNQLMAPCSVCMQKSMHLASPATASFDLPLKAPAIATLFSCAVLSLFSKSNSHSPSSCHLLRLKLNIELEPFDFGALLESDQRKDDSSTSHNAFECFNIEISYWTKPCFGLSST